MKNITARLYAPGEDEYSGTAWLCSDEYALTAAHCVGDRANRTVRPGTYRLRFLWGRLEAEVERYDFDIDAALLRITSGKIPERVRITLGQLPALKPWPVGPTGFQWQSWGYPIGNPSGMRIYGSIDDPEGNIIDDPEAEELSAQIAIQLTCEQGGFDALPGVSGSAVSFDKNVIVGLVRWAPRDFKQKVIFATPLKRIVEVFPEMRDIIQANLRHAIEEVAPNLLPPPDEPPEAGAEQQPAPAAAAPPAAAPKPDAPQAGILFGREGDINEVGRLLREEKVRLLTFVGGRGAGKTVLARAVCGEMEEHFQNGAYFIDLSLVRDPRLVANEIAHKLGVKEVSEGSFEESLGAYLGDRPTLLILDGFEDLSPAQPLVEKLLARSSRLQVLVTCNAALGWPGERVYEVKPLSRLEARPSADAPGAPESAPAVALFLDRARRANPEYKYDPATLDEIRAICEEVGGVPLAIELAAALSAAPEVGPERALERLKGREVEAAGGRLNSLIELCYRSLGEGAQECLRRLTVFAGPASAEAAEAVAAGAAGAGRGAREELERLAARSLLCVERRADGGMCYRMSLPVLEYCAARLKEAGEDASARRAHAVYYSQLTKKAERRLTLLTSAERREWLELLEAEHDEIRAAMKWSKADAGCVELCLDIVGSMFWFWNLRAYLTEGRRWADSVLAAARPRVKGDSEGLGKALYCAGGLAFMHGDYPAARELLEENAGVWTRLANHRRLGYTLIVLGMVALNQNRLEEARQHEERCVALFKEVDDRWGLALAFNDLGNVFLESGDIAAARSKYEHSLAVWRELDDQWGYGLATSNLAKLCYRTGDVLMAKQLLINASAMQRDEGNQWGWAESIERLGHITFDEGDYPQAAKLFYDSLALHQKIGRKQLVADCLDGLAQVATAMEQPDRAAWLYGAATAVRRRIDAHMSAPQAAQRDKNIAAATAAAAKKGVTGAEFEKLLGEGEAWTLEVAVAEATGYAAEWSA